MRGFVKLFCVDAGTFGFVAVIGGDYFEYSSLYQRNDFAVQVEF